jgi:hypothetical protein
MFDWQRISQHCSSNKACNSSVPPLSQGIVLLVMMHLILEKKMAAPTTTTTTTKGSLVHKATKINDLTALGCSEAVLLTMLSFYGLGIALRQSASTVSRCSGETWVSFGARSLPELRQFQEKERSASTVYQCRDMTRILNGLDCCASHSL